MGECKHVKNMIVKQGCELVLCIIFFATVIYKKKKKHTPSNAQVQYQIKQQQVNKKKHVKDW